MLTTTCTALIVIGLTVRAAAGAILLVRTGRRVVRLLAR